MANDVSRNLGPGASGSYSYESVGNAEDLSDILVNIDPDRTKFLSAFGTADDAISTDFSWFTERMRPPQDNAHLEKEEYAFAEIDSQEGLRNFIQHFQNTGFVTDTQKRIKKYSAAAPMNLTLLWTEQSVLRAMTLSLCWLTAWKAALKLRALNRHAAAVYRTFCRLMQNRQPLKLPAV